MDREAARRVLEANDRGSFTVPADGLYPYQWLWDSAFAALGWACVDEVRAWQELRSLVAAQWPSGMLPHIVFHRPEPGYFPGPKVWGVARSPASTGITQPPVVATVARRLWERARDRRLADREASELLPHLVAYHRWLRRVRDPDDTGLVAILHPWESGMDNSPAWDEALSRVPDERAADVMGPAGQEGRVRRDVLHVEPDQRPSDLEYRRYVALVLTLRDHGYDSVRATAASPFRVADVGFNALLYRADLDLLGLAQALGRQEGDLEAMWEQVEASRRAIEGLWSEQAGLYLSRDLRTGRTIPLATSAGLLPLFAGIPSPQRAARMVATLEGWGERVRYLVPSADPAGPIFEPRRYWRGPVWIHVNWMVAAGLQSYGYDQLAERVRRDSLALIERSGFREYYDPLTGEGLGARAFTWSAALALDWTAASDV
ncbi:amylo-alpha-1,6-glucosidase [Geochorda subterranea]|uniref:Trehalase family glycosidase n=1 Tax=Geochorda subterranea TaxID=3109564 RepID=A0ABZ1BT41_9FIRM|nr:trehalase family glycosidase [Limnochorda sp. LNt]WRP16000.1 trehalase family glycosidase [Limnochorda sp. LNt]